MDSPPEYHRGNKNLVHLSARNKGLLTPYDLLSRRIAENNPYDSNLLEISFIKDMFQPKEKQKLLKHSMLGDL